MTSHRSHFSLWIAAFTMAACATTPPPPSATPISVALPLADIRDSRADTVSARDRFRVWEAVLRLFGARVRGGEAAILSEVARDFGQNIGPVRSGPLSLVLMAERAPGLQPYDSAWLGSLVERRLVGEVCRASKAENCPDTVVSTFLSMSDPYLVRGDTFGVHVGEVALNPGQCRRSRMLVGSDDEDRFVVLTDTTTQIVSRSGGIYMSGSGFCGHLPPDEQARVDRINAEDSVVRSRPSPIAGTYRFVVTLANGSAVTVYSRTEAYPMGPFRAWKEHDVSKPGVPITGYNLMADCAIQESALALKAQRSLKREVVTCYHSVSVAPWLNTADSTVWRGDPEAALAAWILWQHSSLGADLRKAASDDPADSSVYYMPGYWIVYRDGRVRFRRVTHDATGAVIATVTGERISNLVLQGHSR